MRLGATDCERISDSLLAQPVNSLSSLAFAVAGSWLISRRGSYGTVAFGWTLTATGLGSFLFHGPQPPLSRPIHDVTGLASALGAVILLGTELRRLGPRALVARHGAALGLLCAALAVYAGGRTGSPLCRPGSPIQLHAAWHVLAAGAAVAFVARRSQRDQLGAGRRYDANALGSHMKESQTDEEG